MPSNSISLEFHKMPTVTVDGKTHKFHADGANGFKSITEGGVTYSLSKDKTSGRYTMTMSGEPAALEKYKFSVGKGRVTEGKFGSQSMEGFFKGTAHVGQGTGEDYFSDFSFAGAHLKDKTSFIQSGAHGLDSTSVTKELERLEDEAKAAAKKAEEAKKTSGTQDVGDQKPAEQKSGDSKEGISSIGPTHEGHKTDKADIKHEPSLTATSIQPLSKDEVAILKASVSEAHHDTVDRLVAKNDTASLREVLSALKEADNNENAHRILSDKANALYPKGISTSELARKTEANLAKLGLKANSTIGDGNCFFHAVADQVADGQGVVRNKVALAMNDVLTRAKHVELPKGLGNAPTREQIDNTLLDASKAKSPEESDKAWGEDFHCAYVARAFDRPVVLIAPDRIVVYEKDKETDTISNASQLPKDAILLSHKGGNHWESASPINF